VILPFLAVVLAQEAVDRREPVAPGVEYRERSFKNAAGDPFAMQILEVDPRHPAVNVVPAHARDRAIGRETTSSLAARYGATAAVNGGFFAMTGPYAGAVARVYALEKQIYAAGRDRAALVFCTERNFVEDLRVATVNYRGEAAAGGARHPVTQVNQTRATSGLTLFRPALGDRTLTAPGGWEVAVAGGRVRAEGEHDLAIPPGGFVLAGEGESAAWLRRRARRGARVRTKETLEGAPCRYTDVLGAGPELVRNGENVAPEHPRHPRTAVGVRADGRLLFVTVDGRQKHSVGMTLRELAQEMLALGARTAINLDGGGSTTMWVRGRVRNSPSDGAERPVSDAVLVYSIAGAADLRAVEQKLGPKHRVVREGRSAAGR
jgi:hypothetical protein